MAVFCCILDTLMNFNTNNSYFDQKYVIFMFDVWFFWQTALFAFVDREYLEFPRIKKYRVFKFVFETLKIKNYWNSYVTHFMVFLCICSYETINKISDML